MPAAMGTQLHPSELHWGCLAGQQGSTLGGHTPQSLSKVGWRYTLQSRCWFRHWGPSTDPGVEGGSCCSHPTGNTCGILSWESQLAQGTCEDKQGCEAP